MASVIRVVGWHHWLTEHEFIQAQGDGEGQAGKPGVLQSMGLQRIRHYLETEQQQVNRINDMNR